MTDFQALLSAALIGTSRTPPPTHAGTPLAGALNRVTGRDAEGTLLARAALAGLSARAGRVPMTVSDALPEPAPAETLPEAPERAARHLPLLLGTPLLTDWLRLCAQAGARVPAAALPELLDLARHDSGLREDLRPVLGERGAWLAGFNPEWRFTPRPLNPEEWLAATDAEKETLFLDLRARDAHRAAAWLTEHFAGERAPVRKRLLSAVSRTFTPDDHALEPLLDAALEDRSDDVRRLARHLLQRLPDSAYSARTATQAAAVLTGAHPADARPATPDERAAVLQHAHPDALMRALNATPADLIALAGPLEMLHVLNRVAFETDHAALAAALLPHHPPGRDNDGLRAALHRTASQGNPAHGLRVALAEQHANLHLMAARVPAPWSEDVTHGVLRHLQATLRGVEYAYAWPQDARALHDLLLHRAHPGARPAPLPPEATAFAHGLWDDLSATQHHRAQLWHDFQTGPENRENEA